MPYKRLLLCPAPSRLGIFDMILSDVCLSVAYVGPKVENREALEDQNWHRDSPRHT